MLDVRMIERGLQKPGKTKGGLAAAMGVRVGAAAPIEPEHEQVPPEGLGEVELPFPISEETIAFEVAGDSMLPKYENGEVIVVFREQRHPLSSFYGEEAAVRLKTGERYLKTMQRGKSTALVNLTSFT